MYHPPLFNSVFQKYVNNNNKLRHKSAIQYERTTWCGETRENTRGNVALLEMEWNISIKYTDGPQKEDEL